MKTLHTASLKCSPPIYSYISGGKYLQNTDSVMKRKRFLSVFLLQTPKISQQSSHLQNTFQPFSEHAFISDWGAQATLGRMNMDAVRCKRVGLCDAVLSVTHPLLSSLLQSHPRCTRTAAAVTQSAAHGVCQQQEPRSIPPSSDRIRHKRAVLSLGFQELQGSPFK